MRSNKALVDLKIDYTKDKEHHLELTVDVTPILGVLSVAGVCWVLIRTLDK